MTVIKHRHNLITNQTRRLYPPSTSILCDPRRSLYGHVEKTVHISIITYGRQPTKNPTIAGEAEVTNNTHIPLLSIPSNSFIPRKRYHLIDNTKPTINLHLQKRPPNSANRAFTKTDSQPPT